MRPFVSRPYSIDIATSIQSTVLQAMITCKLNIFSAHIEVKHFKFVLPNDSVCPKRLEGSVRGL